MSKSSFVEQVARKGKLNKSEAKRMVDLVFGEIESTLKSAKKEGRVSIGTLGTFSVSRRRARMGRNPQTGEPIRIRASKSLRFRPASNLKRAAGC
jgi:DNA-binding protein HU-beta